MNAFQQKLLLATRTAFITAIAACIMLLLAGLHKAQFLEIPDYIGSNHDAYRWYYITTYMLPAYLESMAVLVISINAFTVFTSFKNLLIKEQVLGEIFGNTTVDALIWVVLLIMLIVQATILGFVQDGQWDIPGMSNDTVLYIALGLAAFFGLCGRGIGLTYAILTAGIAGFMAGSLSEYFVMQIALLAFAFGGWLINRLIYLLFFKKWGDTKNTVSA